MHVLLIAEEPDAIDWLTLAFAIRGHRPSRVNTIAAAIQYIKTQPVDLILIDEIDDDLRRQICCQLRTHPAAQTAAIWVVADPQYPDTIVRAIDAGATGYLRRPIDPHQLRERLEHFEQQQPRSTDTSEPLVSAAIPAVASIPDEDLCVRQPDPMFDPLTGLANQDLFYEHLRRSLARGERLNRSIATLLLALPDTEADNGAASEHALREIASGIRRTIREADVAAHLSRGRFAILLDDVNRYEHAYAVAHRIQSALSVTILPVNVSLSLPGRSRPEDLFDDTTDLPQGFRKEQIAETPFVGQGVSDRNPVIETEAGTEPAVDERADVIGRFLALEEHLEHLLGKELPNADDLPRSWPD